jgi:hypothetical protein
VLDDHQWTLEPLPHLGCLHHYEVGRHAPLSYLTSGGST